MTNHIKNINIKNDHCPSLTQSNTWLRYRATGILLFLSKAVDILASIRDQIKTLIDKNLIISSKANARKILINDNYYNVINGYKDNFIDKSYTPTSINDPDEKYITGATFDELYSMYIFDKELRELFLKYFLIVEEEFKTHLAYEFSLLFGECGYLESINFDTSDKKIFDVIDMHSQINHVIYNNRKDDRVVHFYKERNKKVPIWALVSLFEIGKTRIFYSNCKTSLKRRVAFYYGISPNQLISMLSVVNMFRNVCAHNNRLYCYKINDTDKQLSDMPVHTNMGINVCVAPTTGNYFVLGKKDLFSVVICFKYLLNNNDFIDFFNGINVVINKLSVSLHTISVDDVLMKMGFPLSDLSTGQHDWKDILTINK